MLPYTPAKSSSRLGQGGLTSGITSELARSIVAEAEPVTRQIIRDERNRLAEALIGAIPLAGLAAIGAAGTYYLVPSSATIAKFAGYGASAAALTISAWLAFQRLSERPPATQGPSAESSPFAGVVQDAAAKIVREAEPKIRALVDEEKARAVEAAKAGLPLAIGALAAFLSTIFLVDEKKTTLKVLGLSGSAALLGASAWISLEKEREAVSA